MFDDSAYLYSSDKNPILQNLLQNAASSGRIAIDTQSKLRQIIRADREAAKNLAKAIG
jgi:hypothetical protein